MESAACRAPEIAELASQFLRAESENKMRLSAIVISWIGFFCSTLCHAQDAQEDACRITVDAEPSKPPINRREIYDLVKQVTVFVCPYSPGQPLVLIQPECAPEFASGFGKYMVQRFSSGKVLKVLSECSPLLGGSTADYKPDDPVTSYMLVDNAGKFAPGVVRDKEHAFNLLFRQFLNDIGAPVIYYNSLSNVVCLSTRSDENFSLVDAIREFSVLPSDAARAKFTLPVTMSIETSPLSCKEWAQQRFQRSFTDGFFK